MRQFFNANPDAFSDLEQRAQQSCVVFYDQEMPIGTNPKTLRIGFEVNQNGVVSLHVDTGNNYNGVNQEIQDWLNCGTKEFSNFLELQKWVGSELAPQYESSTSEGLNSSPNYPNAELETLTDFTQIDDVILNVESNIRIDAAKLFESLSKHVRGQDESLKRLTRKLASHLARTNPRRPATVFAVGPTGVGKTKTAEILARSLREISSDADKFRFLRLDMAEYQEPHRISQLLGAPQSYIGYGEGSQLIDFLATHSNGIVLFDEIEKAHPDILRTLMNAMDAGRLSSPKQINGRREVDCRKAIFIFTSNIESESIIEERNELKKRGKLNSQNLDETCRNQLRKSGLAPELIGRIGCFLVYQHLTNEARIEVLALSVVRVASEYGLRIEYIAPETLTKLFTVSVKQNFGVRPDEYLIDELLGESFKGAKDQYNNTPLKISGTDNFEYSPLNSDR